MSSQPVAIVTAAGGGIGAACARALAARGHALVLMSRGASAAAVAEALGATAVQGSVTENPDLERLVATAMETHGRIDAVVNNTGHATGSSSPPGGPSTPTPRAICSTSNEGRGVDATRSSPAVWVRHPLQRYLGIGSPAITSLAKPAADR